MSLMPQGVDDDNLKAFEKNGDLPDHIMREYQRILEKYDDQRPTERSRFLRELVNLPLSHRPVNFREHIWYVRFATTVLLLRDFPNSLLDARVHLIAHVFGSYTSVWMQDHKKIHIVAEIMYRTAKSTSNIVFLVSNMGAYSPFTLYVSNALIWAGFYTIVDRKIPLFRMYEPRLFVELIEMVCIVDQDLEKIHEFLSLYSVYQKMLMAGPGVNFSHSPEILPFFECDLADISECLQEIQCKLNKLFHHRISTEKCMMILDLLQYDIMEPLEEHAKHNMSIDFY